MEPKTFYSRCGGYQICAYHGRIIEVDGKNTRESDVIIGFTPMGTASFKQPDGTVVTYGSYTTTNEKEIEFLDKHIANLIQKTGYTDVLTAEMFQKEIVPKDKQIDELHKDIQRRIDENNRLLALVAEQQKQAVPSQANRPPQLVGAK